MIEPTSNQNTLNEYPYHHEIFFGDDWTEANEARAEKAIKLLSNVIPSADEYMICTEEGQPVELDFCTNFELPSATRGRVIMVTKPDDAKFNIDNL